MRQVPAVSVMPDNVLVETLIDERASQRQLKRALQVVLRRLTRTHGREAILQEAFWLEVMRAIIREPWATCGSLAGAVMAERTCIAIVQELRKSEDKQQPLQEFRSMAQRVLALVPTADADV